MVKRKTRYLLLLLFALGLLGGCDWARMRDQESVRTWEAEMPRATNATIPYGEGMSYQGILHSPPERLKNPLAEGRKSASRGKTAYGYFCVQCHGPKADGLGTVGQSFSPLPTDLRSADVQGQSDGALYKKIRLGFKRHPPLYTTIGDPDTWAVIVYMRTLKGG